MLSLISLSTLMALHAYTHFYQTQELKQFANELSAAIKLGQTLSLTRNEDIIICAQKQNTCQNNWQGELIVQSKNNIEKDFGPVNNNLSIYYQAFYSKDRILIQNHGLLMNNGTFHLKNPSNPDYELIISKEGVISTP